MNILYIGYWSVYEGLSEASIRPTLAVLNQFEVVQNIVYVSIERNVAKAECNWELDKVIHKPFYSPYKSFFRDKIRDFNVLPKQLILLCREWNFDKIICRGAPAGALGYLIWQKTKIPFIVESFEPHSSYMAASDVWKKWDIRYLIQKYYEYKQIRTAETLITVSNSYKDYLVNTYGNSNIEAIPCVVDGESFQFSNKARNELRRKMKISHEAVVGVYVGKFGGLYYDDVAFNLFKNFIEQQNVYLIILTPQEKTELYALLSKHHIDLKMVFITNVPHYTVKDYLSVADFGLCLHRRTRWSMAFSPIKNGEYWANGLPIIMSPQIGDDSTIIEEVKGGGKVVDFEEYISDEDFLEIKQIIKDYNVDRINNVSNQLAKKYRSIENLTRVYKQVINKL
ncbi:glycosyltransferase [Fulvivirga ligni]|uniref:glycosyltransferase n=1 Tax=Fulvivirga ligni TaxID=2904246 RepID=UPI001F33176D|nr:glycosyltransferase [Fulvivirga ligni]UII21821.1 glycosyltransferase [Fulvivirga ligni]